VVQECLKARWSFRKVQWDPRSCGGGEAAAAAHADCAAPRTSSHPAVGAASSCVDSRVTYTMQTSPCCPHLDDRCHIARLATTARRRQAHAFVNVIASHADANAMIRFRESMAQVSSWLLTTSLHHHGRCPLHARRHRAALEGPTAIEGPRA
jgi:hypothetical protein